MMHKAWSSIGEVPYWFSRSSVTFRGHKGQKRPILTQIWQLTDGYKMMHKAWSSMGEGPYCFSRSSVEFQGHTGQKMADFDPNLALPDCNYSLNWPMAMKLCINLEVALERCHVVFQGQPSNFKITRNNKIPMSYLNGAFPDCNSSLNLLMALE